MLGNAGAGSPGGSAVFLVTNDVPLLRNSERSDFKRCPTRWNWRWNEGLVPLQFSTGPLVFGTFGHLALAHWYTPGTKRGIHPAETWDKVTADYVDAVKNESAKYIDDDIEGTWEDARILGRQVLCNYVENYGNDEHLEVLWAERPGHQLIPHPYNKEIPIVNYCYTMDLIVRDHLHGGRIRYYDHKFVKAVNADHLYIDDQNGGYLAIGTHELRRAGIIQPKEVVRDFVYNFVRKALPPDKPRNSFGEFLNKDGSVMKRQPAPYFERITITKTAQERNSQIKAIGNEALAMKAFRRGKLPLYKTPTMNCKWDCAFFNLCQVHESGGDIEETKKMLFMKKDPYEEYQPGAISPKRLRDL